MTIHLIFNFFCTNFHFHCTIKNSEANQIEVTECWNQSQWRTKLIMRESKNVHERKVKIFSWASFFPNLIKYNHLDFTRVFWIKWTFSSDFYEGNIYFSHNFTVFGFGTELTYLTWFSWDTIALSHFLQTYAIGSKTSICDCQ